MKKYQIKYSIDKFELRNNYEIYHKESNSLVTNYSEIMNLGLSIFISESDIVIEGIYNDDNYEIMITPNISFEIIE